MQRIQLKGRVPTLKDQQRLNTQRVAGMNNTFLQRQVEETIGALQVRKEQGAQPDVVWRLDYESKGTICIADWVSI